MAFSPDGRRIVSGSGDGTVKQVKDILRYIEHKPEDEQHNLRLELRSLKALPNGSTENNR